MIELALIASLFFLAIAVISSILLRVEIKRVDGDTEANITKANLFAIGMPPIPSVRAKYIFPWAKLQGSKLSNPPIKRYLVITRVAVGLAVFSIIVGVAVDLWPKA